MGRDIEIDDGKITRKKRRDVKTNVVGFGIESKQNKHDNNILWMKRNGIP